MVDKNKKVYSKLNVEFKCDCWTMRTSTHLIAGNAHCARANIGANIKFMLRVCVCVSNNWLLCFHRCIMIVSLLSLTINIHFALMIRGLSRIIQYQSPIYSRGKHGLILMGLMLRAICTYNNFVECTVTYVKRTIKF